MSEVDQLAYQLQSQGPDEFPFAYYQHVAREIIAKGSHE